MIHLKAFIAVALDLVALYKALGGGWQAPRLFNKVEVERSLLAIGVPKGKHAKRRDL